MPQGTTALALRRAVRTRARNRCENCSAYVPPNAGVVDHRTPIAEGGHPSDPVNLWLLCDDCDRAKTRDDLGRMRAREVGSPSPARRARTPTGTRARGVYAHGNATLGE
jgi:5-methylcytosine-specific restriction endonuclease McrA